MTVGADEDQVGTVHVLAPGRDGELSCRVLGAQGLRCHRCQGAADLQASLREDSGAVLLAEEMLDTPLARWLAAHVGAQPAWSDLPLLVVRQDGRAGPGAQLLALLGNVTILTRPMAVPDLLSAARSALRARRRQFQVRQLLEQQRAEARRKDEFLAMLAHELRNPLSPVRYAAHALRAEASSPRARRFTEIIERQVAHMGRIITRLLDVSRLTRGMIRLECAPLDLAEVARRAVQAREEAARERQVAIELHAPGPAWVEGDETRLDQVLENLLENAIKFSPAAGRVLVQVALREGWACVDVHDQGDGIPAADLPHLFEPFVQADKSLDRAGGGIGLGLAMVKGFVELHGGRIEARSEGAGRGSSFHLALPATVAPAVVASAPAQKPDTAVAVRVLLAEDNRDAAEILRILLESSGYQVTIAGSGPAAVEAARKEPHDALLCDIGLPGMNGYEVARTLRRQPGLADMLMIAVTGYGTQEDRQAAASAGFDLHFAKPVDPSRLLAELHKRARGARS